MNTYHDQETQTEERGNNVKNLSFSLQDNSLTNNLYSPGH